MPHRAVEQRHRVARARAATMMHSQNRVSRRARLFRRARSPRSRLPDRSRRPVARGRRQARPPPVRSSSAAAHETNPLSSRRHVAPVRRRRQPLVIIDHTGIASLKFDDRSELLQPGAGLERSPDARFRGRFLMLQACRDQHARRQQHRQLLRDRAGRGLSASRCTRSLRARCRPSGRAARPSR